MRCTRSPACVCLFLLARLSSGLGDRCRYPASEIILSTKDNRSATQLVFSLLLLLYSLFVATAVFPFSVIGAAFAIISFASMFYQIGWTSLFVMTGVYVGVLLRAWTKNGLLGHQIDNTVWIIPCTAMSGLLVGLIIDYYARHTESIPNS